MSRLLIVATLLVVVAIIAAGLTVITNEPTPERTLHPNETWVIYGGFTHGGPGANDLDCELIDGCDETEVYCNEELDPARCEDPEQTLQVNVYPESSNGCNQTKPGYFCDEGSDDSCVVYSDCIWLGGELGCFIGSMVNEVVGKDYCLAGPE